MEKFEWDPAKQLANLAKHGIGFNDASVALAGIAITRSVVRRNETRFSSICNSNGVAIVVIWTVRTDAIRLISARRARKYERKQFSEAIAEAAQAR